MKQTMSTHLSPFYEIMVETHLQKLLLSMGIVTTRPWSLQSKQAQSHYVRQHGAGLIK